MRKIVYCFCVMFFAYAQNVAGEVSLKNAKDKAIEAAGKSAIMIKPYALLPE